MVQNTDISLTALILIAFVLTPLMPNGLLFLIDNPIIRILLILAPFAAMGISHRLALLAVLAVGTLFFERNRRKIEKAGSASWWNSIDGEAIPGPLPKNIPAEATRSQKSAHQAPYMPEGLDDNGCGEEENPIVQSDLDPRPVFETVHGDSSIGNEINGAIGRSGAPVPMSAWNNANDADEIGSGWSMFN
jgi:hypothetical protein